MNIKSGDARLVLLCPPWRRFGATMPLQYGPHSSDIYYHRFGLDSPSAKLVAYQTSLKLDASISLMPSVPTIHTIRGKCDALIDLERVIDGQLAGYTCPNLADELLPLPGGPHLRICHSCARALSGDWSKNRSWTIDINGTRHRRPLVLPTERIKPLSGTDCQRRLKRLCDSMRKKGWVGRPLVVVEDADHYLALTGSHRYAAAKNCGFAEIPCFVVEGDQWRNSGLEYEVIRRLPDDKRVEEFRRVGLHDVAAHIEIEIQENKRDRKEEANGNLEY